MRGALAHIFLPGDCERIIPADAGSTGSRTGRWPSSPDHPRGCGEHLNGSSKIKSISGSSPRMRGAPGVDSDKAAAAGIIPADAGSTLHRYAPQCRSQDHPRGCGEHRPLGRLFCVIQGSSPRMRGARPISIAPGLSTRIIPADAGSTVYVNGIVPGTQDHPRGCGEHTTHVADTVFKPGSSPRMRGARSRQSRGYCVQRIIPADAGSTTPFMPSGTRRRDHPRGCGEHLCRFHQQVLRRGSSPRMRGALPHKDHRSRWTGIIPADAGSTPWKRIHRCRFGDHPRGCGEHMLTIRRFCDGLGSSPRMRGALVAFGALRRQLGIIPADAGSTGVPA